VSGPPNTETTAAAADTSLVSKPAAQASTAALVLTSEDSDRIDAILRETMDDYHEKPESEKAEYRMAYAMLQARRQRHHRRTRTRKAKVGTTRGRGAETVGVDTDSARM